MAMSVMAPWFAELIAGLCLFRMFYVLLCRMLKGVAILPVCLEWLDYRCDIMASPVGAQVQLGLLYKSHWG